MKNTLRIATLNLIGIILLASYGLTGQEGFWFKLDTAVFYFFNSHLVKGSTFVDVVAFTNLRIFDAVPIIVMGLLYLHYYLKEDIEGRKKMLCVGIVMLFAAIMFKQSGRFLPISHQSPSLFFEDANRLVNLTDLPTKDSSNNSFPGDHGVMLMIFAAFMARYYGLRAFLCAVVVTIIFSMPRIASGAHWFSDIYVGSLSIVCIGLSWLGSPLVSDMLAAFVDRFIIPKRIYQVLHLDRHKQ